MIILSLLLIALLAGAFGSMLGVGGGIVMVPALTLGFGVPIKVAIGTSLICVIATSSAAQTVYVSRGMTNLRLGMLFEVATSVGAVLGGVTAVLVNGRVLQGCFAVVLVYVAWQMSRRGGDEAARPTGVLAASYYDPALGREVRYGAQRVHLGFVLSVAAGNISGLLGVGGGAFKVPILNLLMGIPLKATIATSNLMIGVTAATGAVIFYGRGLLDVYYAVPAALGILAGARLGPRLAVRLPSGTLRRIFQVLLLAFAIMMTLEALGV